MANELYSSNLKTSLNTPQQTPQQAEEERKRLLKEQQEKQAKEQTQAVKSSLPPMPQTAGPTTQQLQASTVDPRFQQAITQKFQQDLAAKQAALAKQQQEFQSQLKAVSTGDTARLQQLSNRLESGNLTPAEEQEYQSLLNQQYQGPQGIQGAASAAALSQLAMSPALLAHQYAGGFGGLGAKDLSATMSLIQPSQALQQQQQQAMALSSEALGAEELANQQIQAKKAQMEAIKKLAEQSIAGKEAKFQKELSEAERTDIEEKDEALKNLKEGLFFGTEITNTSLGKLGLNKDQLKNLKGIDLTALGSGFGNINSVEGLDKKIEELTIKKNERGTDALTKEQQRLLTIYDEFIGIARGIDEPFSQYGYAEEEDLSKINALRRIRGQAPLTSEEVELIGKGKESGKVSGLTLSEMIGRLITGENEYTEEANTTISEKRERLTGDKWYKGGLVKAEANLASLDPDSNYHSIYEIAKEMRNRMKNTGETKTSLYKWLENNLKGQTKGGNKHYTVKSSFKPIAEEFKKLVTQNKNSHNAAIEGRSNITRNLNFED